MKIPQSGMYKDNPAWPLLQAVVSFWGNASGDGDASGLTLVCDGTLGLTTQPSYKGLPVKIMSGDAAGQVKTIINDTTIGTIYVADPFTDSAGVVVQILNNTLFVILSAQEGPGGGDIKFLEGFGYINESWEPANVDLNVWTPTHPATNLIAVVENAAPNIGYSVVMFDVEDAENGRLVGRASANRWRVTPTLAGTNHIIKKLIMEWEIYFNDAANVDAANLFMGLITDPAGTRISQNLIGFGLDLAGAPNFDCISDRAGGRVVMGTGLFPVEDTRNKLRIEVGEGYAAFWVNEFLLFINTEAAMLPDQLMYPIWYMPSAGMGADTFEFYLGAVRIGYAVAP